MDSSADEHRSADHRDAALPGVRGLHLPPLQARVPLLPEETTLRSQPG